MPDGSALSRVEARERGQAERLVPMLAEILAEAQIGFGDLDRIAVTTGPGSFTGVRVGLATAIGLGLARDCPVIGIDSFTAFAASMRADSRQAIVIESRRAELYWRIMNETEPACGTPAEIAAALPPGMSVGGDAAGRLAGYGTRFGITPRQPGPDTEQLAQLAVTLPLPTSFPAPVYVRPPDAQKPAGRNG